MSVALAARRSAARREGLVARLSPLAYLAPTLVLVALIYVVPIIDNVRFSFARVTLLRGIVEWTGFDNYARLADPDVLAALGRTLVWLGVSLPFALVFGTALALLLDDAIPGRGLLRTLIILPWVFPEAIFAVMWRLTLHPLWGLANNLLLVLGAIDESINFLSVDSALSTVIGIRIWRSTPFVVLSVLAGLQSIPEELMQASHVDGASLWQRIWHIKLPLLKPVVWATAVILAAWTLVIFDLIFILTEGGPDRATELLSLFIYKSAFVRQDLGMASAASMILVGIVGIFGYFYVRSMSREEAR
jgi:multiple sugar transport system permease protein